MRRAATSDRRCPAQPSVHRRRLRASRRACNRHGWRECRTCRMQFAADRHTATRSGNLWRGRPAAAKGDSMSRVVLTLLTILIAVTIDVDIGAQLVDQDHGQYSRADVEAGQRLYGPQCQVCHGANGDGVPGIDLKLGRFRRSSSDDDLARVITLGVPGTGMPPFALRPEELTAVVAFIRAGFDPASSAVRVGDAARGRELFYAKAECAGCHRVNGVGPRVAPDLSDIGSIRTLAALQRALLTPEDSLLPIHRPVSIVTNDGRRFAGRRLN